MKDQKPIFSVKAVAHHGPWGEPDGVTYIIMKDGKPVTTCYDETTAARVLALLMGGDSDGLS